MDRPKVQLRRLSHLRFRLRIGQSFIETCGSLHSARQELAAAKQGAKNSAAERRDTMAKTSKPNILVMWGDDIGQSNLSIFTKGMMGYQTPNIDRIGHE